ncbi:mechanosensitive ion channel domain-containing protein [Lutibacter sp.]|jgi:small conductance mechanosensitive channel|uniref:mechanosensitive ion channel family protein n=1 Tax=Lutibacter sp. TaxID=1925666 RepID=UPI001A35EFD0|nr:mechanosensitive ion channel domain-containing protein [Lutibacter sp.]MBI9040417.1 mechanosensitive ion channel [Lutibacter sp.]
MDYQKYTDLALTFIGKYAVNVVVAILILIIGLWLSKKLIRISKKLMAKQGIDETLQKFLGDLLGWTLKVLIFITAISQVGVETTSFIAILGAAGLAVGLALQGSLANFAGGALIMIFKPFKVGDVIEAQGEVGTVKEIQIFVTKIITPGNKLAIIPNGTLSNGNIKNYTEEGKLRVDLTFGIGYGEDIKKAKEVFMNVLKSNPNVLQEPAPTVNVSALADSSVNFAVRPWSTPENYWNVYFAITEEVKLALDKEGIEIPYPHMVEIRK